jgi:isopenicillin N synthase-like dioxygenase
VGEPPPEPERPAFRDTALVYMRVLERLCQRLVPIYAIALDMPADTFDAACAEPRIILCMSTTHRSAKMRTTISVSSLTPTPGS